MTLDQDAAAYDNRIDDPRFVLLEEIFAISGIS